MRIPVKYSVRGKDCSGVLDAGVEQTALVLVDMWNWDDPEEGEKAPDYLVNTQTCLAACRAKGMRIIHAPNWPLTDRYPQYQAIEEEAEPYAPKTDIPDHMAWPPRDCSTQVQEQALRNAHDMRESERQAMFDKRRISRYALPEEGELVIGSHNAFRYALWKRGITLLVYAGGALNECMLHRDTTLNRIAGSDHTRSNFTVVVLEDCVYAMPSGDRSREENVEAMLNYYRRKIAFTAVFPDVTF